MINLVKAELYKYLHRPFLYLLTIIVSATILIVEILFSFNDTTRFYVFTVVCPLGINVVLMLTGIFSFVFSEEYKYNSLKNLLTSNISKTKIFFGKVLVQILILLIMFIIILGVFCGGLFLLQPGDGWSNEIFINEILKITAMVPIFLAGLSLFNMLIIVTQRESAAYAIFIGYFFLFAELVNLLSKTIWNKLIIINYYLFQSQTSIMYDFPASSVQIIRVILIGIVSFLIFIVIGGMIFTRTEVK